jgi:hypothetical protein
MYFLDGLLDPDHYVRDVLFKEIDVVLLGHAHLLEFVRVTLFELSDLPVVLLARLTPKHL